MSSIPEDFEIGRADTSAPDLEPLLMRNAEAMYKATASETVDPLQMVELIDPDAVAHVLRYKGVPIALGAFKKTDDAQAEITSLHVMKELRGNGFARVILDHLIAEMLLAGFTKVSAQIGTQAGFIPARMLFASSGFTPSAALDGAEGASPAILMVYDLSAQSA